MKLLNWDTGYWNTGFWHCHIETQELEYWILTLPYWDIGYWNTGFSQCHFETQDCCIWDYDFTTFGQKTV